MATIRVLLLAFTVLLFSSCQQDDIPDNNYGTFIFYKQTTAGSYSIWINNVYWGDVPFVDRTPACNTSDGLRLRFVPGTYSLDVRNNQNPTWVPPAQITLDRGECKLYRVPQ